MSHYQTETLADLGPVFVYRDGYGNLGVAPKRNRPPMLFVGVRRIRGFVLGVSHFAFMSHGEEGVEFDLHLGPWMLEVEWITKKDD